MTVTKKRIIIFVLIGTLLFATGATWLTFNLSADRVQDDFSDNSYYKATEMGLYSHNDYMPDKDIKKTARISGMDDVQVFMLEYLEDSGMVYNQYPYLLSAIDPDGNIYESYKNYIKLYIDEEETCMYIDLDEVLTKEQLETVREIDAIENDYLKARNIKLGYDGEKYYPVEITFESGFNEDFREACFILSEDIPFVTVEDRNWCRLTQLSLPKYNQRYYSKLQKEIDFDFENNADFDASGGGGYISYGECSWNAGVKVGEKYYTVAYASRYNTFMTTLSSTYFSSYIYLALFSVLFTGLFFLFISFKFYKKSEALENSKRTFISAAAHELKTPLAVIQNQCECVIENVVPEKNEEYLRSIHDEAVRMNQIVSSLLSFNRISATDKITKEKCNLSALVSREVEKYTSFAKSKGVEMTFDYDKEVFVSCNEELMSLAVDNYLSNAVKYATGEKKVHITLTKDKSDFTLEVFNTCEPIPWSKISTLWDMFERNDESRTRDGSSTGMGLPICKKVFELHGFSKGYSPRENGAVFFVKGRI